MKAKIKRSIEGIFMILAFFFIGIMFGQDGFNFINIGISIALLGKLVVDWFIKEDAK